jgi:hypothetical protein
VLQPLVLRLCAHITADPLEFRQHEQLVEANVELRARSAATMQLVESTASAFRQVLAL